MRLCRVDSFDVAGLDEFKPGVHSFKSLTAAGELLGRVRDGRARIALVIGAGFIGLGIALLLRNMDLEVRQLACSRVMRQMLDPETWEMVFGMLHKRGIKTRRGGDADAVAFVGDPQTEAMAPRSGSAVSTDLLIAVTGLRPNVELLENSGIRRKWGVLVNKRLLTSRPYIYAAGGVAGSLDRFTGERYVHAIFPNAVEQARVADYSSLGWDVTYGGSGNINRLKHLGLTILAAGRMEGEELRAAGRRSAADLPGGRPHFRLPAEQDVSAVGILRSVMNGRVNVRPFRHHLLETGFGMGLIEERARLELPIT